MAVTDPQLIPRPRAVSRRGWIIAAIAGVLFAVLYLVVAAFYDVEGGLTFEGGSSPEADGVLVHIDPLTVDAQKALANVHLSFESRDPELIDPMTSRLTANTRILVTSAAGSQEFRFPAGESLGQVDVQVGLTGQQAQYPFDQHSGAMQIYADSYTKGPDGTFVSTGTVAANAMPPLYDPTFGVNGWDTHITAQNWPGSSSVDLDFNRALATGASIDIYVYLWVIVGAIVAITLLATSWIAQTRTNLLVERERAKADARAEHRLTGD